MSRLFNLWHILLPMTAMNLCACALFDYHPYHVDADVKSLVCEENPKVIASITKGRSDFSFYFMADSHCHYDDLQDAVDFINAASDVDFVINAGDLSDFGTEEELLWTKRILDKLKVPYLTAIGNHDILGFSDLAYRKVFGPTDFAFLAGDAYFICFNSNSLEYDCDGSVPYLAFLDRAILQTPQEATRTVFVAHGRPEDEQFDKSMVEDFFSIVDSAKNAMVYLCGHRHFTHTWPIMDRWIISHNICEVAQRQMFYVHIKPEGYDIDLIDF